MKRDYPERPIVAVGVIVIKDDKVLLIQRNKAPKLNLWSIPGGAQNLGEELTDTAKREIFEETSIVIKNIKLIDVLDFIERDDEDNIRYHYSLIDYVAEYKEGTLKAGDDACAAKWVSFTDLEQYQLWTETLDMIIKAKNILAQGK
jgi:8-oxo-dGTP diphosphatase